MIRRSVYVRHLIVSGLLMLGMLILMGRGRVPVERVGEKTPIAHSGATTTSPKVVPTAITLSANLAD